MFSLNQSSCVAVFTGCHPDAIREVPGWDIRAQTHFMDHLDGIRGYLYQSSKIEAISKH